MTMATLLFDLLRRPSSGARLNTILTTAGTAGSLISNFFMRLVIARALGPEPLGLYAIALGYQRVAGQIADGGLHYALLRRATANRELLRSGISVKMLFGLSVAIIAGLPSLVPSLDPELRAAIFVGAAGVLGWSQLDSAQLWLRGHSRFTADLVLHTLTSAARVIAALIALAMGLGVPLALTIYFLLPVVVSPIVPLPWALPRVPWSMLRDSGASFAYRTLWLLWLNMDILVLGLVLDIGTVGRYEASRSLAYPVLAIAEGAAIAVLQHVGAGRGTGAGAASSLTRLALPAVVAAPLFGIASYWMLGIVFGPAFLSRELAVVFTLLFTGFVAATAAMAYASVMLFVRPTSVIVLTTIDVVISAIAYTLAAPVGLIAVATAACLVQAFNLAVLVTLTRRAS
jgi:O-antigen/teichoic acid export membrane protein